MAKSRERYIMKSPLIRWIIVFGLLLPLGCGRADDPLKAPGKRGEGKATAASNPNS